LSVSPRQAETLPER